MILYDIAILIIGLIIAIFLLFYLTRKFNKFKNIELSDWFVLALILFNFIMFPFVILLTKINFNSNKLFVNIISKMPYELAIYFFVLNIIFLIIFILSYKTTSTILTKYNFKFITFFRYKEELVVIHKLQLTAWLLFIISFFSYFLYVKAYGGFFGYLKYADAVRSGVEVMKNKFSFLSKFGSLSLISSYIFFSLILVRRYRKQINFLGFVISFLFSFYVLYSMRGRVSFLIYFSILILMYFIIHHKSIKIFFSNILKLLLISFVIIITANFILKRVNYDNAVKLITTEFSFPVISFNNVYSSNDNRFFVDILYSPLYILPSSFYLKLNVETASSYNTYLLYGRRKGEGGVYGELPLDLISFSFFQLRILGIIIISIIFGTTISFLNYFINKIKQNNIKILLYSYIALNIVVLSVLYGDINHIVLRSFSLIFSFLFFVFIYNIRTSYFK